MQLALSVANGTLTLSTTSGLIFTTGANNSSAMTVQGTLSAINAAIAGLKFTPSSNVAGPASLSLTFNDLGVGGAGPAQLISQSVAIMVKYPVTTVVDQQSGYTETAGVWATSGVTGYNGVAARSSSSSNAAATWKPTLVAGEYQVSIYNPATSGASTDVLVTIANNGKTHTFTINEASGTPGYITLGSFYFAGNGNEYVTISQGATAGTLYASAVQFAREGNVPTLTVPATQSTLLNTALVFSTANSNAISIADTSVGGNTVQLALSVANGTLTLSTTSGLIFTTGANNSSAMTVQGTLSAINAAIAGLKFTPSSNVAGPASLSLTFNDLGVGGAGPAQLISQSVAIMVKYPVTTVVDQQSGYTETAGVWATSGVTGYNGVATRTSTSSNAAATWKPTLVAGEYQVSIYNPAATGASTDVLVTIANNGKTHTFTINEASGTPGYITLGSFYFAGNGNEYVTISQGTTAGALYASAAQFVGVGITPTFTVPVSQSTGNIVPLVYSSANNNLISIADASVKSNIVQLALRRRQRHVGAGLKYRPDDHVRRQQLCRDYRARHVGRNQYCTKRTQFHGRRQFRRHRRPDMRFQRSWRWQCCAISEC